MSKVRKTLADEIVAAISNRNYRATCPVPDPPEKGGEKRAIPREARAMVALWQRKRVLAMPKRGNPRCHHDAAVAFLLHQEAESMEYIMCDLLRAIFGLDKRARITPCSGWRCTIQML
jgi:hypothetical protein